MQTPDNIIEIKLQPMIQGLSRAINALDKSIEAQSSVVSNNAEQVRAIVDTLSTLADELRMTALRSAQMPSAGPWGATTSALDSETHSLDIVDPKAVT